MFRAGLILAIVAALVLLASPVLAKREHVVHFQGTAYELHIFKIQGHKPGKTLMLIGDIQGNEPGGFLSADLYADMTLETGNLIVVPRANFYSILLNQRGPNGDMNRKFDKRGESDYEAKYDVSPGETFLLEEDDSIKVVDIKANFDAASEVKLVLRGDGGEIDIDQGQGIRVKDLLGPGQRKTRAA